MHVFYGVAVAVSAMKLHSFVQMDLCIKNAFEGLMNAQQQLSLKKLPDLNEHPKTDIQRLMNGFLDERKCEWRGKVKFAQLFVISAPAHLWPRNQFGRRIHTFLCFFE